MRDGFSIFDQFGALLINLAVLQHLVLEVLQVLLPCSQLLALFANRFDFLQQSIVRKISETEVDADNV